MFQSVTNACEECGRAQLISYVTVGCFVFFILVIALYFASGDRFGVRQWELSRWLKNVERGSLKVLWVTYQIIVSSSDGVGIQVYICENIIFDLVYV
jgi:hypothetical protein